MGYLKVDITVVNDEHSQVTKIQPLLLNEDSVLSYWEGKISLKPGCKEIIEKVHDIKILEIYLKSSADSITSQVIQ